MVADPKVYESLTRIVGAEYVSIDPEECICHTRDLTSPVAGPLLGFESTMPSYVVRPATVEEIQSIVRLANEHKIPIVPYTFGTNMGGTAIASVKDTMIIDLRRMNKILEIDEDSMTATVEPAVSYGKLEKEAMKKGLKCFHKLGGGYTGSVLGNFLTANVRAHNTRYGGDPVVSLEVVLGTGELLRTASQAYPGLEKLNPYVRYAWGPDITGLFRGSAGAFGIITKAVIRLYPKGEVSDYSILGFENLENLLNAMKKIQRFDVGKYMVAVNRREFTHLISDIEELLNPESIKRIEKEQPAWVLWVGLEGTAKQVEVEKEIIEKRVAAEEKGKIPKLTSKQRKWMEDWHSFDGRACQKGLITPFASAWALVPWKNMLEWNRRCEKLIEEIDFRDPRFPEERMMPRNWICMYDRGTCAYVGHDVDFDPANTEALNKAAEFYPRFFQIMTELGAAFTMIHPLLLQMLMPKYAEFLKTIKKFTDPNNIMNPGKILP